MTKSLHESLEKISSAASALGPEDQQNIALLQFIDEAKDGDFANADLAQRFAQLAEATIPPSNNMGGTYLPTPLFISDGEKTSHFVVNRTKIDWLGFTVKPKIRTVGPEFTQSHGDEVETVVALLRICWPGMMLERNNRGMPGYPESYSLIVDDVQYGLFGTGAVHGRHFVSLTGTACKRLTDELIELLYEALTIPEMDARLSRVDICFDVFSGVTWDHAVRAYQQDRFKRPRASKNPEFRKIESGGNGQNFGRTFYVGKRDGEVMGRVYEKGLEIFARMPEELREQCIEREASLEGEKFQADNWLRLEAEYKRVDKDRPLPFEMLLQRDQYFAGAYPYFAEVLGTSDGLRPVHVKSDVEIDMVNLIHHAKRSYGRLIHSMRDLGLSADEIVRELSSDRHNAKLLKSGIIALAKQKIAEARALDPDFDIPF